MEADFCIGLQKTLSYLEQSFNFSSEAITFVLQTLSLKSVPNFRSLSDACSDLFRCRRWHWYYVQWIFFRVCSHRQVQEKNGRLFSRHVARKFLLIHFKLVAYILSMPSSNAFPERVFSLMNIKMENWKEQSICTSDVISAADSAALITSELQVFVTFVSSCSAFYDFVVKEQKLLVVAASNKNIHRSRKLPLVW